jgi:hypothetical protein
MDALQLLQSIEARGGVATVKGDGGAAKINVAPRSLALELLPDLQRFKPALLELLTAPDAPATAPATGSASPFRQPHPFLLLPATIENAPGAAKICSTLQTFRSLFAAARGGDLPQHPLGVEIGDELFTVENVAAACIEIERAWTNTAQWCQHERRDLTAPEVDALDAATQFLETVTSCYNGNRAAWLDLTEILQAQNEDYLAMLKFQHHNRAPGAKETHR